MTTPTSFPHSAPGPGPAADLDGVRRATDRLLDTLDTLDDDAVAQPSLLPGWTRGHVLAHLARNADALVNALAGRPMYASEQARDADIERDAARPAAVHRDDVRDSAARFDAAAARLSGEQWRAPLTLRGGVTLPAEALPFRRWAEAELHHLDLGTGHTIADLPGAFLDRALDHFARRIAGAPAVPPLDLHAEDGRSWHTGADAPPGHTPQVVSGTPAALVGWLTGRTPGSGLTTAGTLPALPPL